MIKEQTASMTLESFYKLHDKVALLFSGGKDSLAMLYLAKPWWDKTYVVWVNTQTNFPEMVRFMEHIKRMVPHFVELKSNTTHFINTYGFPSDVVVSEQADGSVFAGEGTPQMCSKFDCCQHNLWRPIWEFMKTTDATGFLKGQKFTDSLKAPWVDKFNIGDKKLELAYPIADWTDEDVRRYLACQSQEIDERLRLSHSSLDCWCCTAYWEQLPERLKYMERHYPEKAAYVKNVVVRIKGAVDNATKVLGEI